MLAWLKNITDAEIQKNVCFPEFSKNERNLAFPLIKLVYFKKIKIDNLISPLA